MRLPQRISAAKSAALPKSASERTVPAVSAPSVTAASAEAANASPDSVTLPSSAGITSSSKTLMRKLSKTPFAA